MVMGMNKGCDNCINSGRPSYEYPCTVCETAYGSAPSKWESLVPAFADMVEVIRCHNCQKGEPCKVRGKVWCKCMGKYMKEDGFCSEGVMKDG
jgi:hypothetical protein